MNKRFKKICTAALTIAITAAASAISMSVSALGHFDITSLSDYTIIDDKGMMEVADHAHEGYKLIYDNYVLLEAQPNFGTLKFVLSEDVDYEEVNERIIEIFEEFFPDNYLGISTSGMSASDYNDYLENYKPNLWSETFDGVTTYTLCAYNKHICSIDDENIAEARKISKAFMKKLNGEKLISAFYDFGEVYELSGPYRFFINYSSDVDIDLIYDYIDKHNINCTIKKVDTDYYRYKLEFNDDTDAIEQLLIAADIYEETSIAIAKWHVLLSSPGEMFGKNSLEDLTKAGNANEDETTDIRDAAFIARKVAQRKTEELPEWSDYNNDGNLDILDAAAIAKDVAGRILK